MHAAVPLRVPPGADPTFVMPSVLEPRDSTNGISVVRVHRPRLTAVQMRRLRNDVQPDPAMIRSGKTTEGGVSAGRARADPGTQGRRLLVRRALDQLLQDGPAD